MGGKVFKESGCSRDERGRMAGMEVALKSKEDAYLVLDLGCDSS